MAGTASRVGAIFVGFGVGRGIGGATGDLVGVGVGVGEAAGDVGVHGGSGVVSDGGGSGGSAARNFSVTQLVGMVSLRSKNGDSLSLNPGDSGDDAGDCDGDRDGDGRGGGDGDGNGGGGGTSNDARIGDCSGVASDNTDVDSSRDLCRVVRL